MGLQDVNVGIANVAHQRCDKVGCIGSKHYLVSRAAQTKPIILGQHGE
eukprot:gene18324-94_t